MSTTDLTPQVAPRPTDLATLANEINDLHDRATETARTAVEHARACGELLIHAKNQIGHGGFLPWLEANCRVQRRQAQKYMRLAREWPAIEAKCASNAHLTIDGVLRLLDSGEELTQQEPAEIAGATGDPFDEADPFGEGWEGEDGRTDSDDMDADQELPPPPSTESDDQPAAGDDPEKSPEELFRLQRSKTVKTAEALSRAISDLNDLKAKPRACDALKQRVYSILEELKDW